MVARDYEWGMGSKGLIGTGFPFEKLLVLSNCNGYTILLNINATEHIK